MTIIDKGSFEFLRQVEDVGCPDLFTHWVILFIESVLIALTIRLTVLRKIHGIVTLE